jgi:hypothetical protein
MAKTFIVKNSKVEDYILQLDEIQDIRSHYEKGKLVYFDNIKFFEPYKKFLDEQVISFFTQDIKIKKIKGPDLLKPIKNPAHHPLAMFTNEVFELQKIILDTYVFVKQTFFELYPFATIHSENWTWRLTKTKNEPMHLDSYADQDNDLHNVRIFFNIDNKPRTWRVSHPLHILYPMYKDIIIKNISRNLHPNQVNEYLNRKINWNELPYHEIYFAPYSMWVCNSQYIPHQGVLGEKLLAYTFRIRPETMLHPELSFEKLGRHFAWEIRQQKSFRFEI